MNTAEKFRKNSRKHRFLRSRKRIEIDITWLCNLTCFDCNRCCGEAPTSEHMTLDQIDRFIQESIDRDYDWEIIRIVGGEPTIHPQFMEVVERLIAYRNLFSENSKPKLFVHTNGYGARVKKIISQLPVDINVINSMKEKGIVRHIGHFNIAPQDVRDISSEDLTMACTHTTTCGLGLTPNGFYHCPIAGSIDRVFGFDLGRSSIPNLEDDMFDMMNVFCGLCGFFDMDDSSIYVSHENTKLLTKKVTVSKSWKKAFTKLSEGKVNSLTPY